jgi:hypothetical protein
MWKKLLFHGVESDEQDDDLTITDAFIVEDFHLMIKQTWANKDESYVILSLEDLSAIIKKIKKFAFSKENKSFYKKKKKK